MKKEETKFCSSTIFEGMTSIRALIYAIDENISDRRIEKIILDKGKIPKNKKEIGYLRAISDKYGFTIENVDEETIDNLALGNSHGGILCVASERTIQKLSIDKIQDNGFYCLMDGIEDPYNFGYSLRSLYACGCTGILLPERNWMSAAGVVCRSSAGASERFEMFTEDPLSIVKMFKEKGYTIVCADEHTDNILGKCSLPLPVLLLVGGEKRGISKKVLEYADTLVKIDYAREFRASLSAASATTMFAYEIARQNF